MSLALGAVDGAIMPRPLRRAGTRSLAILLVAAIWAICHPYSGIVGDSSIYIGRVLADLDPTGLGRDLMFVNDGQSRFSLFPTLARPLVATLGASKAALVIAASASLCWSLALLALAGELATGRLVWAMALVVAFLPIGYGQVGSFYFGEATAVPRPFAEAAVMAAIAAMLRARFWQAGVFFSTAVLLHPIMALPGLGVGIIEAGMRWHPLPRSKRLILLAVAIGLVAAFAGIGAAVLGGLTAIADPAWLALLLERSPHLFPTLWQAKAFAPIIVQAVTITAAARYVPLRARRLYIAVLIIVASGLAASVVLADQIHMVLAIQAQFWRATWLLVVVGGMAFACRAARVKADGPAGRIALSLLTIGWFGRPDLPLAIMIAGGVLLLEVSPARDRLPLKPWHVVLAVGAAALLVLIETFGPIFGYVAFLVAPPPEVVPNLVDPLRNNLHTAPFCFLLALWFFAVPAHRRWMLALGTVAMMAVAVAAWDQRSSDARYFETSQTPPGFAALAAGRPSEVLWLEGRAEEWYVFGHPQYFSPQQGVSMVFSRPLAMEWHRRASLLVALGLVTKSVFRPWADHSADDRPVITQNGLDALCRMPDAPGVVVLPLDQDAPPFRGMIAWRLPRPHNNAERRFAGVASYGLVPCAPARGGDTKS